jgi:hypothetical protein
MATLCDWFLHYLKQKDLHFGLIKEVNRLDDSSFILKKSKRGEESFEFCYVFNSIDKINLDLAFSRYSTEFAKNSKLSFSNLAVFNTSSNFKTVDSKWDSYLEHKLLKIFMVNPFSELKVWAVNPYSHNLINGTRKSFKSFLDELGYCSDSCQDKLSKEKY